MRLNANGSADSTFSVADGPNNTVWSMAFQPDGKIIVGGEWSTWNGINRAGIVRLNPNGSLDSGFAIGSGANAYVGAVGVLANNDIVLAGNFNNVNGFNRTRLAIVGPDGSQPSETVEWTQWKKADGGNDHFYGLTSRPENWNNAEAEAISLGGHLATVRNSDEQLFLEAAFLNGLNRLRPFWIGYTDATNEGNFTWSSGETNSYADWNASEPNDLNNEDYAVLNWHYTGSDPSIFGLWNDVPVSGTTGLNGKAGPYFGIIERAGNGPIPTHIVYNQDFEGVVGGEWSNNKTSLTPAGDHKYLGDFGNQTVTLTVGDLPASGRVRVSFDLFILNTWDGSNGTYGPDLWSLAVRGGPVLLRSTFSNNPNNASLSQSYPAFYPDASYPGFTGAAEFGTLGYPPNAGYGSILTDSIYHLNFDFDYSSPTLLLDFTGAGLEALSNESWGLDNMQVALVESSAGLAKLSAFGIPADDGKFQLGIAGISGATYSIEGCADLKSWSSIGQAIADADGAATFIHVPVTNNTAYFYRAVLVVQ